MTNTHSQRTSTCTLPLMSIWERTFPVPWSDMQLCVAGIFFPVRYVWVIFLHRSCVCCFTRTIWFSFQLSQTITWWASLTVVLVIPLLNNPPPDAVGHIVTGLSVGFQHGFWLLGLGLMFYILSLTETNPHALPVKRFLSSSLFRPVSRLSFCIYLTHMTLIWFNVYAVKAPLEVNTTNIVSTTWIGQFVHHYLTLFLSCRLYLCAE